MAPGTDMVPLSTSVAARRPRSLLGRLAIGRLSAVARARRRPADTSVSMPSGEVACRPHFSVGFDALLCQISGSLRHKLTNPATFLCIFLHGRMHRVSAEYAPLESGAYLLTADRNRKNSVDWSSLTLCGWTIFNTNRVETSLGRLGSP